MKTRSLLLAILSLILIPMTLSAWDTRLQALGDPALNLAEGLPSTFFTFVGQLPTDAYGVGLSAISDPIDIFTLPQQLGNEELFPSNGLILEWTSTTSGNGGLIWKPKGPMTFALFLFRPGSNAWVNGAPRQAFGLGSSFAANSTLTANGITAPSSPTNIFDFFFSYKLGNLLIGASVGFAYGVAADINASTSGTPNSTATDSSSSLVATGRLGASLPLGPVGLDTGLVVVVGSEKATLVTGTTVPTGYTYLANQNNSLSATNVSLAVNARASLPLADKLDFAGLGNFSMLPQNYSASNAAGAITTSTALIDPSGLWSAGTGGAITWKASDALVITGYLGAIVGAGNWVGVIGASPSSTLWVTLRPLLSGELKPFPWLTVRGGVSYSARYDTTTRNVNTGGTASTTVLWETGASVNAGMSIQLAPKAVLEMVINLANFTGGAGIAIPFVTTSLKMDQ